MGLMVLYQQIITSHPRASPQRFWMRKRPGGYMCCPVNTPFRNTLLFSHRTEGGLKIAFGTVWTHEDSLQSLYRLGKKDKNSDLCFQLPYKQKPHSSVVSPSIFLTLHRAGPAYLRFFPGYHSACRTGVPADVQLQSHISCLTACDLEVQEKLRCRSSPPHSPPLPQECVWPCVAVSPLWHYANLVGGWGILTRQFSISTANWESELTKSPVYHYAEFQLGLKHKAV